LFLKFKEEKKIPIKRIRYIEKIFIFVKLSTKKNVN